MNAKKCLVLLIAGLLTLSLAACGAKKGGSMGSMSAEASAMTNEPKNAEEAAAMHKDLMAQEKAILSKNTELWEKVFMETDKGMILIEDGKNYGEYLLDTIESIKDQFTPEELKLLRSEGEKIRDIESKLTMLEEKFPSLSETSSEGDSSMSMPAEQSKMQQFPSFAGKDLDGKQVKSDKLFSSNAVTVVNFWFTTCNPCVGELAELDALKGGTLIGVNTSTLDGDKAEISDAKDVLMKKGATYQNVYFDSNSEAGKFATNLLAYPTTYVVDRKGNIVGEPIVGAITEKKQAETLQKRIDQALAADRG